MLRLRHESRYGRERGLSRQEVTEEGTAKLRGLSRATNGSFATSSTCFRSHSQTTASTAVHAHVKRVRSTGPDSLGKLTLILSPPLPFYVMKHIINTDLIGTNYVDQYYSPTAV